jgi:hypothetical protein
LRIIGLLGELNDDVYKNRENSKSKLNIILMIQYIPLSYFNTIVLL